MEQQRARLKKFISRFFRKHELQDDEDMFELGIVNSLFAMQLVMFVESELGVALTDSDLDLANFRSVDVIMALINSKSQIAAE